MKIAIEGMDGVGKTTIAKLISEKYGYLYIEKPLSELFNVNDMNGSEILAEVSKKIYGLDAEMLKAWFFGLGNLLSFEGHKNDNIVLDRHFVSNYFWNGSEKSNVIYKTMIDLIGVPDITILLYASPQTRFKRLYDRDPNDYDLTDTEKHVWGYDKMIKFVRDFSIPYIVVDTEGKDINQVFQEVDTIVSGMIKNGNPKIKVKSNVQELEVE